MIIKTFKNGNFNVKFDRFDRTLGVDDLTDFVYVLCDSSELDFVPPDEIYIRSLGNSNGYMPLYNANTDMFYNIIDIDADKFFREETIKLIGYKGNEDDYAEFKNTLGE